MSQQVEDLSNEFNILLTQYKDTYQDYINVINSDDKSFTTMSNFSFIGENNINTLNNSSLTSCQTSCSENAQCSGATFNNNSQNCILSSGSGSIVNTQQSTAIVQEQNSALNNNYNVLSNERIEIEQMIRQFETLNAAYQDGNINTNSNYNIYISLLFITIILVFLLVKYSISNQQRGGGSNFSLNNNFIITILGLFIIFLVYKIINK